MKTKETSRHQLYKTDDKDAPDSIKDNNGEVVLSLCKVCGKGEAELVESCESMRKISIEWWNGLENNEQQELVDEYLNGYFLSRHRNSVTGREIEEIWRKEVGDLKLHKGEIVDESYPKEFQNAYLKPNQKQFKKFDPELFKTYINKFSDKDKIKAFEILENSISNKHLLIKRETEKYFR